MKKNRRVQELLAAADAARQETTASAKEVMDHLQQALLAIPPFTLKDGTKAQLNPYISPELNKDGQVAFGVDVLLENRGHLEIMVTNTGWGKSFHPHALQMSPKRMR